MLLRRAFLLALTTGLLVVSGCGEAKVVERAHAPRVTPSTVLSPPTRPRSTVPPDVHGALVALERVARWASGPPAPTPARTAQHVAAPVVLAHAWAASFQPCDGMYPPCAVVDTESGGNYNAVNPTGCGGSGCFGKWQFSGEWACKLGLPCDLRTATPQQQDDAARLLWNGGAGCSNWSAC